MPNKNSNVSYDQIPHIVINHPDTKPEHKEIMRALFKILKDISYPIIYSNESLSKNCRMPLRNIERRISELCKMGFIICTGRGLKRRIKLGLLFNTTANMAVEKSTTANMAVEKSTTAKISSTTAKSDPHNRQYGGHYKSYTKNYTKEDSLKTKNPYQVGAKLIAECMEKLKR